MMKAHRLAALAAVLVAGSVTPANAVQVTYSTTGRFASSNSNVLTQNGVSIRFNELSSRVVDPPLNGDTQATFGTFETLAVQPAGSPSISDSFTLTIMQTTPGVGTTSFVSSITGNIFFGNSQAFVDFAEPLQRFITAGGFTTSYRIVEGDLTNPGRVDLLPTIGDLSTVNGRIGISVVPEPGTMAMACAALPLLGLGYARRRRQMAKV